MTVTVGSLRFLASVTAGSASTVSAATNSAVMALVSILSDMDGLSSSASKWTITVRGPRPPDARPFVQPPDEPPGGSR